MAKTDLVANLLRLRKALKRATIAFTLVFGVIFVVLFIWGAIAPDTVTRWAIWMLIAVTALSYLFAGAYFLNGFIIKSVTVTRYKL